MRITEAHAPISTSCWYLNLHGLPEIQFKDGLFQPTSVTVTKYVSEDVETFFFSFVSEKSKHYARFSSTDGKVSVFDHVPLEVVNGIYRKCV